jgi:predicted nucleotidyltransferase/HEPN domain-containing protein
MVLNKEERLANGGSRFASRLVHNGSQPLRSSEMRTDLDHLPAAKQRELERVVQILFEEFEEARVLATQDWKKKGRILKIILYGSYARGGWVDEPHTAKGYRSDFDLLIIVNDERLTDRVDYWAKAEERLNRELAITKTLKTPVNFIVHSLREVNDGLAHGRFFFMDVARDGVALYQSDDSELAEPKPKTPDQALAMAREYFEEWFPSATKRFEIAKFDIGRRFNKDAAFDLHQTAERLYHCVLLVCTFYTPHVHNLGFLRTQAERLDRRLTYVWPMDTRKERAMFEKLKDAYVKARYSRHYRISDEELAWLSACVEDLGRVVQEVCLKRIQMLERSAAA